MNDKKVRVSPHLEQVQQPLGSRGLRGLCATAGGGLHALDGELLGQLLLDMMIMHDDEV